MQALFSGPDSPGKSCRLASSDANRLPPAARAAGPAWASGAATAAAAARMALAPPDVASSCAAFSRACASTDAGKPTASATWMPKDEGQAPSRTCSSSGGARSGVIRHGPAPPLQAGGSSGTHLEEHRDGVGARLDERRDVAVAYGGVGERERRQFVEVRRE